MKKRYSGLTPDEKYDLLTKDFLERDGDSFVRIRRSGRIGWEDTLPADTPYSAAILSPKDERDLYGKAMTLARQMITSMNHPYRVNVRVDPTRACTDSHDVYVATQVFDDPKLSLGQKLDTFLGMTVHEGSHLLYTDFRQAVNIRTKLVQMLQNVFEDERIERVLGEEKPGLANFLKAMKYYYFGRYRDNAQAVPQNKPTRLFNAILSMVRYPAALVPDEVREFADELLETRDILTPFPQSTAACIRCAEKVAEIIKSFLGNEKQKEERRLQKQKQQQEQQEQNEQKGRKGRKQESDRRSSSADASGKEDEDQTQRKDRKAKGQEDSGKEDGGDDKKEDADPDGSEQSAKHPDSGEGKQNEDPSEGHEKDGEDPEKSGSSSNDPDADNGEDGDEAPDGDEGDAGDGPRSNDGGEGDPEGSDATESGAPSGTGNETGSEDGYPDGDPAGDDGEDSEGDTDDTTGTDDTTDKGDTCNNGNACEDGNEDGSQSRPSGEGRPDNSEGSDGDDHETEEDEDDEENEEYEEDGDHETDEEDENGTSHGNAPQNAGAEGDGDEGDEDPGDSQDADPVDDTEADRILRDILEAAAELSSEPSGTGDNPLTPDKVSDTLKDNRLLAMECENELAIGNQPDTVIIPEHANKPAYDASLSRVRRYIPAVAQALRAQGTEYKYTVSGTRSGMLDTNRLAEARQGVQNVYMRKGEVKCDRISIALVIDESGSMNGERARMARDTAVLVNEAVGTLRYVDLYIYGYTSALAGSKVVSVVYPYRENRTGDRYALGSISDRGGTPTAQAISEAAFRIRRSTQSPTILIVVSDGYADGGWREVRRATDEAKKRDIQTVGISISSSLDKDTLKLMYDRYIDMHEVGDLASELGRTIRDTILKTTRRHVG